MLQAICKPIPDWAVQDSGCVRDLTLYSFIVCVAIQGAAIKLYKGLACPLDDFELLLCSLSGPDGMTYPLCPFCYNNPPFEGIQKVVDSTFCASSFAVLHC